MGDSRTLIWRYYVYQLSHSNGFYLPISVLYLQAVRGFGLDLIGLTLGAFSIAMVAVEIPTGYVGDRLGRRASLGLSNALTGAFMLGYVVVESPLGYVGLHVVWAVAWAFRSGTRDAWLYELLASTVGEETFTHTSGRATTIELGFEAASALAVGGLVLVDWRLPFLVNAGVALAGIPVLATFPAVSRVTDDRTTAPSGDSTGEESEPARGEPGPEDSTLTVREALAVLRVQVTRPEIRWFVAYAALFKGLFSVTRTFEQPAMESVGVSVGALGVVYAAFKLVSAGAASTAGWVEDRLGVGGVYALLGPVYGVAWASIGVAPALVVPLLFLNRGLYRVVTPIQNQYLNDRLADVGRATALSGASMALSVSAGVAKFVAGGLAGTTGLVAFLAWAGVAVGGVGLLLWLAVSPVRSGPARTVGSGRGLGAD